MIGFISDESGSKSIFSNNILRLKISSPNKDYLSVINITDIFKQTISRVITKLDIEIVKRIVYYFIKNPRSIILTIVPANVDIAT